RPLLQLLHRAGLEMICAERAIQVVSLEHQNLAFVVTQLMGLAVDVRASEIGRGFAHLGRSECAHATRQHTDPHAQYLFHSLCYFFVGIKQASMRSVRGCLAATPDLKCFRGRVFSYSNALSSA